MNRKFFALCCMLALALAPSLAHAALMTVSKNGVGFTTATYTNGVTGLNTAIQSAAPGDEIRVIEPGDYTTTGTINFNVSTTRTAYTVRALIPGVRFVRSTTGGTVGVVGPATPINNPTACTVNISGIDFVTNGAATSSVFQINQSTGTVITANITSSTMQQLNTASGGAVCFLNALANPALPTAVYANAAQVKTLNANLILCTLRTFSTARACMDLRNSTGAAGVCNANVTLTTCSLSVENPLSTGANALDLNNAVFYSNINLIGCSLVRKAGTGRPLAGNNVASTRFAFNNVTCTNTVFRTNSNECFASVNTTTSLNFVSPTINNVGGNKFKFNRCLFDCSPNTAGTQRSTLDFDETNANNAPITTNTIEVYNSVIIPVNAGQSTNDRCIRVNNYNKLTAINNTFIATIAEGSSAIATAAAAPVPPATVNPVFNVKNSIFYNFRNPIGAAAAQNEGAQTTFFPAYATNSKNIIVGAVDDPEAGANRIFQAAPAFASPGSVVIGFDLKPLSGSVAINAGDSSVASIIGALDRAGIRRDVQTDIGAYEFIPTPNAVRHWDLLQ